MGENNMEFETYDMLCAMLREAGFSVRTKLNMDPRVVHLSYPDSGLYYGHIAFEAHQDMLWRNCFFVYYADPDLFDKLRQMLARCKITDCDDCEHQPK